MKPWGWPLALEIVSPSFHSRLSCLVLRVPIFISSLSLEHVFFNGLRCSLAVSFICSRNFFFIVQSSWKWKKLWLHTQEENEKEKRGEDFFPKYSNISRTEEERKNGRNLPKISLWIIPHFFSHSTNCCNIHTRILCVV
jgi:hypothetical protein